MFVISASCSFLRIESIFLREAVHLLSILLLTRSVSIACSIYTMKQERTFSWASSAISLLVLVSLGLPKLCRHRPILAFSLYLLAIWLMILSRCSMIMNTKNFIFDITNLFSNGRSSTPLSGAEFFEIDCSL